jgi:hypothetical protein
MRTMANLLLSRSASRAAPRGEAAEIGERFLVGSREHDKGRAMAPRLSRTHSVGRAGPCGGLLEAGKPVG